MPSHQAKWGIAALTALFLAAVGAFAYLKLKNISAEDLGARGWVAMGIAVAILVGKMLLKGIRNKSFQLHEQGEENCLLAVGAALPTAADYAIQQKHGELLWIGFAFGAVIALLFAIFAASAANAATNPGKERSIWTVISMLLGAGSFLLYMLLVVLKAQ